MANAAASTSLCCFSLAIYSSRQEIWLKIQDSQNTVNCILILNILCTHIWDAIFTVGNIASLKIQAGEQESFDYASSGACPLTTQKEQQQILQLCPKDTKDIGNNCGNIGLYTYL